MALMYNHNDYAKQVSRACHNKECDSYHRPLEAPAYEEAFSPFFQKAPLMLVKKGTPHVTLALNGKTFVLCPACATVYGMLQGVGI